MKEKIILKICMVLVIMLIITAGLLTWKYMTLKDNIYNNTYYNKLSALKKDNNYDIITAHIKSMDRDIPNYTSSKLLVTNQKYDRIMLDNGKAYLIRNTDCKMTDNSKLLTVAVNKNNQKQSFIFPRQEEISLTTAFYTGEKFQKYISGIPKIVNCSAISVD